ncbi:MAG: terminase small subunit [Methylobacter tundripaludum]|jgi:phage terminase small subunit|nr:terminase small subunit [Methylobacter tundripaludum]
MNNKQEAFVNEYLKDHNGTQAAIRAGYSKRSARAEACRLLTKDDISAAIKARIAERTMDSDEVLTRLADIGRGNLADLMDVTTSGFTLELMEKDEAGNLVVKPETKLIKKIKQKVTTHIAKNESDEDREVVETEIELYSAQEALNTIAKLNGMITDKLDLTSKGEKLIEDDRFDRAISTLADAVREIIPDKGTK